jgi:SPP1 gp7 family putative phage head morphogenesis protein
MNKEELQLTIINALTQHNAYLQRLSSSTVNQILALLDSLSLDALNKLQNILSELNEAELIALASAKYTTPDLKQFVVVMNEWQSAIATQLPELFAVSGIALAEYEQAYIYQLADKKAPAITGKTLYNRAMDKPFAGGQLFKTIFPDIAARLRKQVEQVVRDGVSNGQTNQQIIQRIKGTKKLNYNDGLLTSTRNEIDAAVKTARAAISSNVYVDTWKALGFPYLKDIVTLDGRTSPYCASIDGRVQKNDGTAKQSPYHFRCRTIQIGCDKDGNLEGLRPFVASDKPVSKIPKDQRDVIIGQVDANTTFPKWFKQQDEQFQVNWLGISRYKLYKDGKFTLDKFVDPLSGKLFTLDELRKVDSETFRNLGL